MIRPECRSRPKHGRKHKHQRGDTAGAKLRVRKYGDEIAFDTFHLHGQRRGERTNKPGTAHNQQNSEAHGQGVFAIDRRNFFGAEVRRNRRNEIREQKPGQTNHGEPYRGPGTNQLVSNIHLSSS